MPAVHFTSQDHIELYEQTASEFFRRVLDMDFHECFVSDESRLCDFSSCGMPDTLAENADSLKELYRAWDNWVLEKLKVDYGLTYETTAILLVTLFRDIEGTSMSSLH